MKTMKKFVFIGFVISLFFLFLLAMDFLWVRARREIVIYQSPSRSVRATIPFCPFIDVVLNCTYTISLPSGEAKLLFNAFERPGHLWYSAEKNALFIYYVGDTKDLFLVIEPKIDGYVTGDISRQRLKRLIEGAEKAGKQKELQYLRAESHRYWNLERVVQSSSDALTVRYMTEQDLLYVLSRINELAENEFREAPTSMLELGLQKLFAASRDKPIFALESLIKEKEPSWRYFMPEQELRFLEQISIRENERSGKM